MVATNFLARAAVLLSAATHVSALGTAVVHNSCDFDVYLWSVGDVSGSMEILPANGGEWSEGYRNNPDGGGISVKVGSDTFGLNVTQFEYTLEGGSVWYDLSLINGFPFVKYGVSVIPSVSTCNAVICPAGIAACAEAYMVPSDNFATARCNSEADSVMMLCAGDESTGESPSASSAASSAAATTASTTFTTHVASTHHHHHSTTKATYVEVETPATTAAPTEASATQANDNVVVHTTFVTYVVTVEARDAAPTPAPVAKRADRHHRHQHGQQKRHEHGHVHHENA